MISYLVRRGRTNTIPTFMVYLGSGVLWGRGPNKSPRLSVKRTVILLKDLRTTSVRRIYFGSVLQSRDHSHSRTQFRLHRVLWRKRRNRSRDTPLFGSPPPRLQSIKLPIRSRPCTYLRRVLGHLLKFDLFTNILFLYFFHPYCLPWPVRVRTHSYDTHVRTYPWCLSPTSHYLSLPP